MEISLKLKEYEGTPPFNMLINLVLVANDGRCGALLEFSSIPDIKTRQSMMIIMDQYIKQLGLFIKGDPLADNRFFVYKDPSIKLPNNDREIGQFLGFLCIGHDYDNNLIPRITGHIIEEKTQRGIYTEICETQKITERQLSHHLATMSSKFNRIMKRLCLDYHFSYKVVSIESWVTYVNPKLYKDTVYVAKNSDMYINILQNMYYSNTRLDTKGQVLKYFELFVYIMDRLHDDTWNYLYSRFKPGSLAFSHFQGELGRTEKYIFENHIHPRDYNNIYRYYLL